MAQFLLMTPDVDLEAMVALQGSLDLANNGYVRKDRLTPAQRGAIKHLVHLELAVETAAHVYTPESYDIFVVQGLR